MQIHIESTHLGDVKVIVPDAFEDDRGFFMEAYRQDQFTELGLPPNLCKAIIRFNAGSVAWLTLPMGTADGKTDARHARDGLSGRRRYPKRFSHHGQWYGAEVSAESRKQIWRPRGSPGASTSCLTSPRYSTIVQGSTMVKPRQASGGMIQKLESPGRSRETSFSRQRTGQPQPSRSGSRDQSPTTSRIPLSDARTREV